MIYDERKKVVEHAFKTPDRLRVALTVAAAYGDIRSRLIKETLKQVEERLGDKIGADWVFECDYDFGAEWRFAFRRNEWPASTTLGFKRDTGERLIYFYVNRWNAPSMTISPVDDRVRNSLETRLANGGKPTEWCCWWKYLDRYRTWDSHETMLEFAMDPATAVEYLVNFLLNIKEVVEPIFSAHLQTE